MKNVQFFKKVLILLICLTIMLPYAVFAEEDTPTSLEAPKNLSVRLDSDTNNTLILRMTQPDSIINLMNNDETWIQYEFDWKVNNGSWNYNTKWESPSSIDFVGFYDNYEDAPIGYLNTIKHDDENSIDVLFISLHFLGIENFDLQNNTYTFRFRYVLDSPTEYEDPETGDALYKYVVSPYSKEVSIGKNAQGSLPNSLEAPLNLTGELKTLKNGQPYFNLTYTIPESVKDANQLTSIRNMVDWKIGNGTWASENGLTPFHTGNSMLTHTIDIDPIESGAWDEINIEENTYYFRMYFEFEKTDKTLCRSPYSNVIQIGTPSFYKSASPWAEGELNKAVDYGFITDKIKSKMDGPITREVFCEVVVKYYEKMTNTKATYNDMSAFTDTTNPEIFKAYELEIVNGVGNNRFTPNNLVTREQISTMIYRAVKAVKPDADFSTDGAQTFDDSKLIASWALEAVKFSNKNGIIKGVGDNRIDPQGTTTREQAVIMIVRAYEKYK